MVDSAAVLEHAIKQIERSDLHASPFPFICIDGIFPDRYYRLLLDRFPDTAYFAPAAEHVSRIDLVADPAGPQGDEWLYNRRLKKAPQEVVRFWEDFTRHFFSRVFMKSVLHKFGRELEPDDFASARLAIDHKGAGLGPHRDRIDKLTSMIFYLPEKSDDDTAKAGGTQLLVPKDRNLIATDEHYTFDEFNVAEHIECRPNRMLAFLVGREGEGKNSFHGYHQTSDVARRTIKSHIHKNVDQGVVRRNIEETKPLSKRWRRP